MIRLSAILIVTGALAGLNLSASAQTLQPSPPAPMPQAAQPAPAPLPQAVRPVRADKRAQHVAVRQNCRAHGKAQLLSGLALRDYVKTCTAMNR